MAATIQNVIGELPRGLERGYVPRYTRHEQTRTMSNDASWPTIWLDGRRIDRQVTFMHRLNSWGDPVATLTAIVKTLNHADIDFSALSSD
jgi:hypothetical protein